MLGGRPITAEEFERMLPAVPKARKKDPDVWTRYLTGLWLSGLRLEESTVLSWDLESPFAVDLSGRHPRFRIYAEAEKGNRDRLLPMTPDFAEWLLPTPEVERDGRVFKLNGVKTGTPITPKRVSRIITKIGKKAGVVVNKAEGKFASAHDLRRTFGTRWARKVMPAVLRQLMRHSSIETTMAYYVDLDADAVADELWAGHEPTRGPEGTISCTTTQDQVQEREGVQEGSDVQSSKPSYQERT
jgi:integrase